MTVGVAIPAWNAQRWLAQALDSVLGQTRPPDDVLVLDDGSSDATAAIAERYPAPVRVVRQANAGIGAARNRAVELVRGEVVVFLDADDLMTPCSLGARVAALARDPRVDIVFGCVRRFTQIVDGAPVALDEPRPAHIPGSMLMRRAALERVGPFPVDTQVAEGLDWLLRARELALGEVTVEEQVLWRRVHGANNSLRHSAQRVEFARALKASLDRRRVGGAGAAALREPARGSESVEVRRSTRMAEPAHGARGHGESDG